MLKAKIVIHITVASAFVRFCSSTRRRSPLRVEIDEVGSSGMRRKSNAMEKALN